MKIYLDSPYIGRGWLAWLAAVWLVGCVQLDTTPAGNPDRVLKGTVNFNATIPAGAEVIVRLVEPASEATSPAKTDIAVPTSSAPRIDRVLSETRVTVETSTQQPLPFQLEYHAEDSVLRRGVGLEVRVSVGGKVRWRTINAHVVTLASSPFKQEIWVQPVQ